jgi:thiol-disulfide isomerase/thioredoxin
VLKVLLPVAVFAVVGGAYFVWRRPPDLHGQRVNMGELGVRGPAIIQFTARSCAPCRTVAPRLHETAVDEAVTYAQVDVGARPEIARAYGIRSVPTIVVASSEGRVLGVWTGVPENGQVAEAARRARTSHGPG